MRWAMNWSDPGISLTGLNRPPKYPSTNISPVTTGNAASVDDQGRTLKIAKQDKACKKAKAKSKPVKDKQNTDFVIDNQYMGG